MADAEPVVPEVATAGEAETVVEVSVDVDASAVVAADAADTAAPSSSSKATHDAYDVATLRQPISVADMGRPGSALFGYFGTDLSRRGNMALIEDELLVYVTGNAVVFEGVGRKDFLMCVDDGGVGCVVVHPSRKMFAVGGKGFQPNIYVYSYPEKQILRVLKGGAEKGYASLSFNKNGDKLASVSTSPDFMLTVWDWEEERVALHSKAFGQDVFSVRFSLDDERRLTTCGTGHIRFWKLAATFTGLKLQGSIGKFGKVELSDIAAFVEFPDGKVVSGTETGSLLLWEGNFIKCRFVRTGGAPCHDGDITYVELDRVDRRVVTAGADGYVRWWKFETIDTAEVDADISLDFVINPVAEYCIGAGKGIKTMVDTGVVEDTDVPSKVHGSRYIRSLYVVDSTGATSLIVFGLGEEVPLGGLSTVVAEMPAKMRGCVELPPKETSEEEGGGGGGALPEPEYTGQPPSVVKLSEYHSGEITGMDTSPLEHVAVTGGRDGSVRVWNYVQRTVLFMRTFTHAVTSVRWVPLSVDPTGRLIAVGFADGIVRVLRLAEITPGGGYMLFKRKMVFKPHNAPVVDIAFSNMNKLFATTGMDGLVFFFDTRATLGANNSWTPLKFVKMGAVADAQGRQLPQVNMGSGAVVCERLSWRPPAARAEDADATLDSVLCSCNDGVLRELHVQELLVSLSDLRLTLEQVTYQTVLPTTERIVRLPLPGDKATASTAALTSSPSKSGLKEETEEAAAVAMQYTSLRATIAVYDEHTAYNGFIAGATWAGKAQLARCLRTDDVVEAELAMGVYAADGKDYAKTPQPSCLRPSWSRQYLLVGAADGSVTVRPSQYPKVFFRFVGHNGAPGGASVVAASFDDNYLLSAGRDGLLSVHRLRQDIAEAVAKNLQFDLEANIFDKPTKEYKLAKDESEPAYMHQVYNQDYRNDWKLFAHVEAKATMLPIDAQGSMDEPEPGLVSLEPEAPPAPEPEAAAPEAAPEPEAAPAVEEPAVAVAAPEEAAVEEAKAADVASAAAAAVPAAPVPVGADVEAKEIPDGAYSIEDAKKKSEEDAKRLAAEELKSKVRHQVKQLQEAYMEAVALNEALPPEVRLTFEQMAVDGEYLDMLRAEGEAKLDEVHKECAYEAEKAEKLRRKVTTRLMGGILVTEIPLMGFDTSRSGADGRSTLTVKALRCKGLHASVKAILDDLQATLAKEETERAKAKQRDAKADAANEKKGEEAAAAAAEAASVAAETASLVGGSKAEEKKPAMSRREMRKLRMDGIAKHLAKKPSENDDDPRDLMAIKIAEKTVGDYKLKVAEDYEISEEHRVNASKKLGQMALLEESMVTMRLQFNERFLALRELKRQIIYAIKRDNARLRAIDDELGQPDLSRNLWEPALDPREFPDDADEVSEKELEAYKATRATTAWAKARPPPHTIITGTKTVVAKNDQPTNGYQMVYKCDQRDLLEGKDLLTTTDFLADPSVMDVLPPRTDDLKYYEVSDTVLATFAAGKDRDSGRTIAALDDLVPVLSLARSAMKLKKGQAMNERQRAKIDERRRLLEFERRMLMKKTESNVKGFEEALEQLRVDRHLVLADLKLAELKMLCLYQEYKQLQTFEAKDLALQQRQRRCEGEKNEIAFNMADQKQKLDARMEDMKGWVEKLSSITAELKAALPDSNPFAEILNKIYKKKIKRNKAGADGEEEEEEEEEEDGDDDDEEEEVEDICPIGCDRLLYDRILELRDRRTEVDEMIAEIQKSIDDLKKTTDRLKQREKQILKDAVQAELEVQQFQLQKQASLNQINVVVPLNMSQIYTFNGSGAFTGPTDGAVGAGEGTDEHAATASQTGAATAVAAATAGAGAVVAAEDGEQAAEEGSQNGELEKLRNAALRNVVTDIDIHSHVLFSQKNLLRLQERIGELHKEILQERDALHDLYKERVRLNKERDVRNAEINVWEQKCKNIQMLKFGRILDLDAVEAGSDRTQEVEAEKTVKKVEDETRVKLYRLQREIESLEEKLAQTTVLNTDLLNTVANLTEAKLNITRELNSNKGPAVSEDSVLVAHREKEERKRMKMYLQLQAREIAALKAELTMLKRKDVPPLPTFSQTAPVVYTSNNNQDTGGLELPPLPASAQGGAAPMR